MKDGAYNAKQLVARALQGEPTPRPAVGPLAVHYCAGIAGVSLHICGDARPILADMRASGADALELDYRVPFTDAARSVGPDVAIWRNLDPVGVLARGSVAQVRQATRELLQDVDRCGHRRFVLSSGCTTISSGRCNIRASMPCRFPLRIFGNLGSVFDNRVWSHKFPGQGNWVELPTICPDSSDVTHHPFQAEIDHFIDCIRQGRRSHCDLDDAIKTHEVAFAALESCATNRPVKLPLLDAL